MCQTTNKLSVGVIGLGWWGPKLLRSFVKHKQIGRVVGCDVDQNRRRFTEEEYHVSTVKDVRNLVGSNSADVLVIATPPSTHYEIAKLGLEQGKHILLTKPPTLTITELEDLIRISEHKRVTLMLDSAFIFEPCIEKMKSILEGGAFPEPTSIYSFRHGNDLHFHHITRLQNTMFKNRIDVVDDLLFHDLALITFLFQKKLRCVSIRRFYNLNPLLCDSAVIELESHDFPIHISLSWTLPERKRQFLIFSKNKYLLFDDLREAGKLRLFEFENKTETDIFCEEEEPLFCEVDHFVNCVINGKKPITGGPFMLQVMEIYDHVRHAKE